MENQITTILTLVASVVIPLVSCLLSFKHSIDKDLKEIREKLDKLVTKDLCEMRMKLRKEEIKGLKDSEITDLYNKVNNVCTSVAKIEGQLSA